MKQLTKANKDYTKNAKVVAAVKHLLSELNRTADLEEGRHFQWGTRYNNLVASRWGALDLIDFQSETEADNYGVVIFEHNGDLFPVPGFAADMGWTGRSVNGQYYTVGADEKPIIEED